MNGVSGLAAEGFYDASSLLRCGVYALTLKGEIVYIGRSIRLYERLYAHAHAIKSRRARLHGGVKRILFDGVVIRPCALEEVESLEARLIREYKPKHNTRLIGRTKERLELVVGKTKIILNDPSRRKRSVRWPSALPGIKRRQLIQVEGAA